MPACAKFYFKIYGLECVKDIETLARTIPDSVGTIPNKVKGRVYTRKEPQPSAPALRSRDLVTQDAWPARYLFVYANMS